MKLFLFLIVGHIVADFMLQFGDISYKKRFLNKEMLIHIVIIAIFYLLPSLMFGVSLQSSFLGTFIVFISHLFIDLIRVEVNKKYDLNTEKRLFWILLGVDQLLHTLFIYLTMIYIIKI